jgi:proteic killer suppression protein
VIRSFRSKALRLFASQGDASKLSVPDPARVARQLALLNAAVRPEDLDLPGFRFHSLNGKPKRYSVRVTANYRLTFGWDHPDAIAVDLEDYHG